MAVFPRIFFGTWRVFQQDPRGMILPATVVMAALATLNAAFSYAVKAPATVAFLERNETSTLANTFGPVGLLLGLFTVLFVLSIATLGAARIARGQPASLDEAVSLLGTRFWRFCAVWLAMIAPLILAFSAAASADEPGFSVIAVFAGFLLAFVLIGRWLPAATSVLLDADLTVATALRAAARQTAGHRTAVTGAFLTILGICAAVTLPIAIAIGESIDGPRFGTEAWRETLLWSVGAIWLAFGATLVVLGACFATAQHALNLTPKSPSPNAPDALGNEEMPSA